MNKRIVEHVNRDFKDIKLTKELNELKEEIIMNLSSAYEEHLKAGLEAEDAFLKATHEFGAINELIADFLEQEKNLNHVSLKKQANDLSTLKAIYWPLVIIVYFILSIPLGLWIFSWLIWPVAILIYIGFARKIAPDIKNKWFRGDLALDKNEILWIRLAPEERQKKQKIKDFTNFIEFLLFIVFVTAGFITGLWYLVWLVFPISNIAIKLVKIYLLHEYDI